MLKYIFSLFFTVTLFAQTINESLLQVHAALVPKIFLMDYEAKEKCQNDSLVIALLYNEEQLKYATLLKEQILQRYPQGIKDCTIVVKKILYSSSVNPKADIYYLFPSSQAKISRALKSAVKDKALSFSYRQEDLALGVMVSVKIGTRVRPVLNLEAIRSNHFTFRPVLLEISEIYGHKGNIQ